MANKEIFLNSGAHKVDLPKGTFDKSFRNHLTAKLGYLYPCLVEEAVADSTYHIRPDMVFDLMPMAMPLQCRMRAHVSFFNVPFRILMKNYKDYFSRVGVHAMPYIARDYNWVTPGSLADYMGVPTAQFSETSAYTTVNFTKRGYVDFANLSFDTVQSLDSPAFPSGLQLYQDNTLILSSASHRAVVSEPLVNPFSGNQIKFNFFGIPSISNLNFYLYLLVGTPEGFHVLSIPALSDTPNFTYASSVADGKFTEILAERQTVYTAGSMSISVNVLTFRIRESLIPLINRYFNLEGFSVRLMLLTNSIALGSGTGGVPNLDEAISTVRILSSFRLKPESEVSTYEAVTSLPYFVTILSDFRYSALIGKSESDRGYFQVVDGEPPALPINALAFRAYEFIYNKYFRNLQVDKFYINGEPSYNVYLTNDGDGADSTTPVELKRVPYEYDVFTTALPSPQMGYAPLVGVTTNNASGTGILHMIPLVDGQPDPSQAYDIAVSYNSENGDVTAISNYDEVANKTSVARLQEAIDFGISINDLRNVSAFQRLKEKMMKAGYEYQALMEEFFGTTPPIGEEFPEYLGGFTREIKIGKIQNTALTAEHPLGEFAGVGGVAGSSRTIKVFIKEPSYIIGVLWFSVTPTYSQMLPKHFLKFHPLDYFNPTFNAIGPQPIHTHEIAPLQLPPEDLNKVFGYQRPWYDYVSRVDECHGEFRTSMRHYLLQRLFAAAPELTANFINIHSEELTDIFTYTVDTDKFFGYIDFDIKCKSPVARVSVPRIIG